MDTKHFTPAIDTPPGKNRLASFPMVVQQQAEVQRLLQENVRLRHQVSTLETRLAELRGMVHDFLTTSDPV